MDTQRSGGKSGGHRGQRGIALVIALLVLVALSFAGVAIMSSGVNQNRIAAIEAASDRSLECAVAGGGWGMGAMSGRLFAGGSRTQVMNELGTGGHPADCSPNCSYNNGNLSITFNYIDDGNTATKPLTSTADRLYTRAQCATAGSVSEVEMLGSVYMGSSFSGGVSGCTSVTAGATLINSYDSANGVYNSSTNVGTNGHVVCDGPVTVNTHVYGNVYAMGAINGGGTIDGDAWSCESITGVNVLGATFAHQCPTIQLRCDNQNGVPMLNGENLTDQVARFISFNSNIPMSKIRATGLRDAMHDVDPCMIDERDCANCFAENDGTNANGATATAYLDKLATIMSSDSPTETVTCRDKYFPNHTKSGGSYYCNSGSANDKCCFTDTGSNGLFSWYDDPCGSARDGRYQFSANGNDNCSLSTGHYYMVDYNANGNSQLMIDHRTGTPGLVAGVTRAALADNVVIILDDPRTLVSGVCTRDSGRIFNLTGTADFNTSDNTTDFEIYGATHNEIRLTGNGSFSGALYAPWASFILWGNSDVFGAIVGDVITTGGSNEVHYDEQLMKRGDFDQGLSPVAGTWRVKRP